MRARIRAGMGIGDALYLQAIVRYLAARGEQLEVCTAYPELFPIPGLSFAPFSRANIRYTCHYVQRKHDESTHQFQDMCRSAGITEPVELRLEWTVRHAALIARVRAAAGARPLLFVNGGREAFGRSDGFGAELLPQAAVFNAALAQLRRSFFAVYCGRGSRQFPVPVDLDLSDQTTVAEMVDIACVADAFYGQCSFVIPLAESLGKPVLVCFAARGFASRKPAVRTITPKKVLSQGSSHYFVDSWEANHIDQAVSKFCALQQSRAAFQGQAGGGGGQCAELLKERAGVH